MRHMKSIVCITLIAAVAGCYGPFRLTKKLHAWNGQLGDKWVNEAVFLGLNIIPVYGFAALADAIVTNSIEFWTGKNPITASRSIKDGDREAVLTYNARSRRLRVDGFEKGRPVSTVVLEPDAAGMRAVDGSGALLATAQTEGDTVALFDAKGRRLAAEIQK